MLETLKTYLFLCCLLVLPNFLFSQPPSETSDTTQRGGFLQDILQEPDSFKVDYFYVDNPKKIFYYSDTLLGNFFHQPQPSRSRNLELINLGNLGTPQQVLVFQPGFRKGFDVGFKQYDGYQQGSEELAFYKIDNAFTDAAFSQGRTREDQYLTAIFSRNFGDHINYSLDLKKVNHLGVYKNQKSQHTTFSTGIWYHHPNGVYDGFLVLANNSIFQGHNGGIDSTLVNEVNQTDEETVPVRLESTVASPRTSGDQDAAAQTRYQSRELSYAHYFTIGGPKEKRAKKTEAPPPKFLSKIPDKLPPPDSLLLSDSLQTDSTQIEPILTDSLQLDTSLISTPLSDSLEIVDTLQQNSSALPEVKKPWKREFRIFHKISLRSDWYKFADTNLASDSIFYKNYQVHNSGLRYFIQTRSLENTIRISTSKKETDNKQQRGRFEVGLIHRLIQLDQEPKDKSTINNLLLTGTWDFSPTPQLNLKTYAHYGVWKNAGDYYLGGTLNIDFGKAGQFEAKASQQHYSPTLVQSGMYISSQKIWEKDFNKTFETTLAATYRIPALGTEVSGQYHLLNNYIYFDTLAQPQQSNLGINIPQLIVKQKFKWRFLHLDNVFALQLSSAPEVLPLPNLYGKHSLYAEGKIFRKIMLARLGIDLLWNSNYKPNAFQHLFGQFYLQQEEELGYYPQADVYFSMKVKTLRAFVKGENMSRFFISDFIYKTPGYPIPYMVIRFGLSWRFLN